MLSTLANTLGPWGWVIVGVLLVLLELIIPGVFIIWLGLAAIIVGVLDFWLDLSWQFSTLLFCGLSAALVVLARNLLQRGQPKDSSIGILNHRGLQLVGNSYVLEQPIVNGEGRIKVADSSWPVTGPDLPAGTKVKVVRSDGVRLIVEKD